MEFLLTSTSGGVENQIPNAVIKKYTKMEVRNFSSFEEFDKRLSWIDGNWLSKGVNHKTSKGRIQREFPQRDCSYSNSERRKLARSWIG